MSDRIDLHDLLERRAYDHAVICTYTFTPEFFEDYCLDRFNSLASNGNITVLLDAGVYDECLSGPPSEWPRLGNVRYLLHPVKVRGRFHPKLFLFASKDRGLLIVGSANFTRAGLTHQAELAAAFRWEKNKREDALPVFREAARWIRGVATRWPGSDLESNLDEMLSDASWLAEDPPGEHPVRLVSNLERSIWSQLVERVPRPVEALFVLSRYFDASPAILERVKQELQPKKVVIYTQNGLTTMTEAWMKHPLVKAGWASVRFCTFRDEEHGQQLHAKAVAILGERWTLAFGSANFTTAALLSTVDTGNVETMIVSELPRRAFRAETFFDPDHTAQEETLRPAKRDLIPASPNLPITLREARLNDTRLECDLEIDAPSDRWELRAILVSQDDSDIVVPLRRDHADSWSGELDAEVVGRCADTATLVFVEEPTAGLRSNRVLLINLQDLYTGKSVRRERRIRDAQKSAAQFAAVLEELIRLGDEDAIHAFLSYCDIPVVNSGRNYRGWLVRPPSIQYLPEIRMLGDRNLRSYATLHEAAVGFCERHLRRLERHCEAPTLTGLPNCMHIALSVARVLESQVERLLVGLECTSEPLDHQAWSEHRTRLDRYLTLFRSEVALLNDDYLPKIAAKYGNPSIRKAIDPDLQPLRDVCARFLQVRERIDACRSASLRVRIPAGAITAPLFSANVVSEARWEPWFSPVLTAAVQRYDTWLGQPS